MRRLIILFLLVASGISAQDGDSLLQAMDETLFPRNYRMTFAVETTESNGRQRNMELSVNYLHGIGSYMEMLAPARSRGTRFLQRDDALWMFIPRSGARSAIRLSGRDSFQGSVFSNRDMGESSYTQDYHAQIIRRENFVHDEMGEVPAIVLEAVPAHEEAAYGRLLIWLTEDEHIPLRLEYFVRSGMKVKVMDLFNIQNIAGRRRPLRMEMRSLEEEGKVSVVRISELEAVNDFPARIFTQQYLTR